MHLFKHILSTFFPQKLLTQQFNPISMMLSVLSPKQFFDYVSRRITDNYKLNLSDINLDSYVRSISPFAAHHGLTAKDIELYYGYHAAGHLNGHTARLPDTIASTVTLALVRYAYPSLSKEHQHDDLSLSALTLTVYFLIYLFMTHIKVFGYTADPDPASRKKETYNRFVTLF